MKHMIYTDNEGFMWVAIVPDSLKEGQSPLAYPVAGPPDLSVLGLSQEDTKRLHNGLVEKGMYNAPALLGETKRVNAVTQVVGTQAFYISNYWCVPTGLLRR